MAAVTNGAPVFAQVSPVDGWNGHWRSSTEVKPAIELKLKNGKFEQMLLDGAPRSITEVEVSPDEKTVLFSWDGGQGTLHRTHDTAAEISIFAPKIAVRNARVTREK